MNKKIISMIVIALVVLGFFFAKISIDKQVEKQISILKEDGIDLQIEKSEGLLGSKKYFTIKISDKKLLNGFLQNQIKDWQNHNLLKEPIYDLSEFLENESFRGIAEISMFGNINAKISPIKSLKFDFPQDLININLMLNKNSEVRAVYLDDIKDFTSLEGYKIDIIGLNFQKESDNFALKSDKFNISQKDNLVLNIDKFDFVFNGKDFLNYSSKLNLANFDLSLAKIGSLNLKDLSEETEFNIKDDKANSKSKTSFSGLNIGMKNQNLLKLESTKLSSEVKDLDYNIIKDYSENLQSYINDPLESQKFILSFLKSGFKINFDLDIAKLYFMNQDLNKLNLNLVSSLEANKISDLEQDLEKNLKLDLKIKLSKDFVNLLGLENNREFSKFLDNKFSINDIKIFLETY